MDTIYWALLAITFLAISIFEGVFILRSLRKVEVYEEWILMLRSRLQKAYGAIKGADIRGSFEADDEVGIVFKVIKNNLDDLEKFTE